MSTWFRTDRILVPFDFSENSVEAVKVALQLARSNDDVHVLYVLPELPPGEPIVVWDKDSEKHRMENARKTLEEKMSELGISHIHVDLAVGNPSSVVADLAEDIEAGLIIIPSHGRTGLRRILLGSVAERVVRLAPCPVLVLKRPKDSQ